MPGALLGGRGMGLLGRGRAAAGNGLLNNLVAYWALDEAGGANNALDKHTNGLTLTQVNSPNSAAGIVYPNARTRYTTEYFSRVSEALLNLGDVDFTIAAWVYIVSLPANAAAGILGKYNSTGNQRGWQLDIDRNTNRFRFVLSADGVNVTILSAANYGNVELSKWLFVCASYDSQADKAYISINNGNANEIAHVGGAFSNTANIEIFRAYQSATEYWARMGPLSFWKSAAGGGGVLTATQRTALYNGGAGLAYASFTA